MEEYEQFDPYFPQKFKKKRAYFRFIQKTIEFYLSDANLRKDVLMKDVLNKRADVAPSFFLSFRKIARLGATVEDIYCALKPSPVLGVNAEGNIFRKHPIIQKEKEEVDLCTIYVERIPLHATTEMVAKIFSAFGSVAMVTLPKYKHNNKLKGFAFVEFEAFESACAALKMFASIDAIINCGQESGGDAAQELGSYLEYAKKKLTPIHEIPTASEGSTCTNEDIGEPSSIPDDQSIVSCTVDSAHDVNTVNDVVFGDSRTNDCSEEATTINDRIGNNASSCKDDYTAEASKSPIQLENPGNLEENVHREEKESVADPSICVAKNDEDATQSPVQQVATVLSATSELTPDAPSEDFSKRKRNRKKRKSQRFAKYMGVHIMSKIEWNRMRQKYLSMQKKNRHRIKLQLGKIRRPRQHRFGVASLLPGTIVTVIFPKPASESEVRSAKATLRQFETTEYVDLEADKIIGHVRMATPEAALWLINQSDVLPTCQLELMPRASEDAYWEKIEYDRSKKFSEENPSKKRGGDRLDARAERQLGVKLRLSPEEPVRIYH